MIDSYALSIGYAVMIVGGTLFGGSIISLSWNLFSQSVGCIQR